MRDKPMTKRYVILVNGVKAKERLTLAFALKDVKDLVAKGYKNVSVAEKLDINGGSI
jgi:hypothetical protein